MVGDMLVCWECRCSIGLMTVSGVTSFCLTTLRTGMLICSMCLAKWTVSFFQELQTLPQNLHSSSFGFLGVSCRHSSTSLQTWSISSLDESSAWFGSSPRALFSRVFWLDGPRTLLAFAVFTFGSGSLCSRTRCCTKLSFR